MKPDLTSRRVWLIGGGVLALLVMVCSYFFVIRPQLDDARTLANQTATTLDSTGELQDRIAALRKQRHEIAGQLGDLHKAVDALPFGSGLSDFTRQLTAQAATDHVQLGGISVGSITALAPPVPVTPDPSASPSPSPSPTDSATATEPSAAPVAGAVQPGGTYMVQVSVSTSGSLADQLAFLNSVQYQGPRPALVTSTALDQNPAGSGGGVSLTSQLVLFSSPQTPERVAQLNKLLHAAANG